MGLPGYLRVRWKGSPSAPPPCRVRGACETAARSGADWCPISAPPGDPGPHTYRNLLVNCRGRSTGQSLGETGLAGGETRVPRPLSGCRGGPVRHRGECRDERGSNQRGLSSHAGIGGGIDQAEDPGD